MTSIESFFGKNTNSPFQSPATTRKQSVVTAKIKLEQVLRNTLESPFSYADYYNYSKSEGCQDSLDFLKFVKEYYEHCKGIYNFQGDEELIPPPRKNQSPRRNVIMEEESESFGEPVKPTTMDDSQFQLALQQCREKLSTIVCTFVQQNSPSDLQFPASVRQEILDCLEEQIYHPDILTNAVSYIKKQLSATSFPKFVKHATRVLFTALHVELPKLTINQLVMNELPPPYSYTDFYEFLKIGQQEENLEFLNEVLQFQKMAVTVHPVPTSARVNSRNRSSSCAPPPIYIDKSPESMAPTIPESMIAAASAVIPQAVKPPQMTDQEFEQHLVNLKNSLKTLIDRFVKPGSEREVNLPLLVRKPLLQLFDEGHTHPDILNHAYEHISHMLRLNGLEKFTKQSFQNARVNAILEQAVPKYSIQQLINNELPKPYRRNDYYEFLKKLHCEESLDFLVKVAAYEKEARGLYSANGGSPRDSVTGGGRSSTIQMSTNFELSAPVKPDSMSVEEFDRKTSSLQSSALDIIKEFIDTSAKREINIPVVIRKPLLQHIEQKTFHPAIFHAAKKHITDMLQVNTLSKFLRTTYEEKMTAGLSLNLASGLKTKVDQLLADELPVPYTYTVFLEYCKVNECMEGVEIARAIMQYQKLAIVFFPLDTVKKRQSVMPMRMSALGADALAENEVTQPSKPRDWTPEEFQNHVKKCESAWSDIFQKFLTPGASQFVTIPLVLMQQLNKDQSQNNLHPDIFTRVYDYFATNLENHVWEQFHKSFEGSPTKSPDSDYPKYTIKQIVQKETTSPYSYDDYMEFLKKEMCDECLEFLALVYKYQLASASLYPEPVVKPHLSKNPAEWTIPSAKKPNHLSDEEYESKVTETREQLKIIVEKYVRPDSPREVNLPVFIRKPFLKLYEENKIHPDLLIESYDHITNMLRLNNLTKFLKKGYQQDPKRKDSSPTKPVTPKAGIKEVVLAELAPPYSVYDFRKFLQKEHTEESLDFLLAVIDYHKLASPYFPNSLNAAPAFREIDETLPYGKPDFSSKSPEEIEKITNRLKDATKYILETFIQEQSPKEININSKQRKTVLSEVKNGNYHPEVWKPVFEHISNLLKTNSLMKFMRSVK